MNFGRETAIRCQRRSLVAAAGILLVVLIAYFFLVARAYNLDLTVYRSAISWWWSGHDPYDHLYSVHQLAFTYPPFALLALSPLAAIPAGLAKLLWFLLNIAALATSLFIVFRSLKWNGSLDTWLLAIIVAGLSVFLLEPVRSTIDYGQVNAVIMVACLYDLLWPSSRWRGVLIGCAGALKLTPLIFVLFFLVKRDVKALYRTVDRLRGQHGSSPGWSCRGRPTSSGRSLCGNRNARASFRIQEISRGMPSSFAPDCPRPGPGMCGRRLWW